MSLGLSKSDVDYLKKHTGAVNIKNTDDVVSFGLADDLQQTDIYDTDARGAFSVCNETKSVSNLATFGTSQSDYSGVLNNPQDKTHINLEYNSTNQNHFVQMSNDLKGVPDANNKDIYQNVLVGTQNCSFASSIIRNTENRSTSAVQQDVTVVHSDAAIQKVSAGLIYSSNISLPGTSGEDCAIGVPIQVLMGTGTTNTQTYVLPLTVDNEEKEKEHDRRNYAIPEPQRTSSPEFLEGGIIPLNDTIVAGNFVSHAEHLSPESVTHKCEGTVTVHNATNPHETASEPLVEDASNDKGGQKEHLMQFNGEKKNEDKTSDLKTATGEIVKLESATDSTLITEKESSMFSQSEVNENKEKQKYFKDWVFENQGNVGTPLSHTIVAQNEISVGPTDMTSSSLNDVTSVSRNVPEYREKRNKIKTEKVSSTTETKVPEVGENM